MSKVKNLVDPVDTTNDRLDAIEELINEIVKRLDEKQQSSSVSFNALPKVAVLPDTIFTVEGRDYKFDVIAFVIKNLNGEVTRLTAEQALNDEATLAHIVENYPDLVHSV